jgi:hypothetical protein
VDGGDLFVLESLIDGSLWRDPFTNEGALQAWEAWDSYPGVLEVQQHLLWSLAHAPSSVLEAWGSVWFWNIPWGHDVTTPEGMARLLKDMGRHATLVMEMGQLARQAVATGRDMYVWLRNGPARAAGRRDRTRHVRMVVEWTGEGGE